MFLIGTIAKFLSILFLVAFALSPSETKAGVDSIYVVTLNDGSIIKAKSYQLMGDDSIIVLSKWGRKHYLAKSDIRWLTYESYKQSSVPGEKSPAAAFVLSFLVTGLGQCYNGQFDKGVAQFLLCVAPAITGQVIMQEANKQHLGYYFFGVSLGVWVWSMIDAPVTASKVNNRLRTEHTEKATPTLRINAGLLKHGNRNLPGIMAQLRF